MKRTRAAVGTTAVDGVPAPCATEADQQAPRTTQWEAFPQPAGWSADWDFEELDRAPRLNGRSAAVTSPARGTSQSADEG